MLDVALIQSLVRKGVVDDRVADYGHLVVDECHHLSAHSFEQVARRAKAQFVLGLSATVTRKDGHHPIIFMQCGPVRYRVERQGAGGGAPLHALGACPPDGVSSRPASPTADKRIEFQALYRELVGDERRNRLICDDVLEAVREGRSPLVLTERTRSPGPAGRGADAGSVRHLLVLRGGWRNASASRSPGGWRPFPDEEARVLLATGRYIGEGFDDARLDTLFLTLPISWRGTVAQYVGRLHRLHEGKREVRVYDYADLNVADAGPDVRPALPGLRGHRLHHRPARERDSGVAVGRTIARRSGVEARLRRERAAPGAGRRGRAAGQLVRRLGPPDACRS